MIRHLHRALLPTMLAVALLATACGGGDTPTATNSAASEPTPDTEPATEAAPTATGSAVAPTVTGSGAVPAASVDAPQSCADIAAVFVTKGSANPSLVDPEVNATCADELITIIANGIPDYTYIETSPGDPRPQDLNVVIPATPTVASEFTAVPLVGPVAIAINGIPIYGPTEGQGADVLSLGGGLSECGSHNGPGGFHIHIFDTSSTTDCIYTPAEVADAPQLFGYAFDGYPIYTGNDQYTSSWVLTDESLFAVDTWAAHSYLEGSGDLDECNGLVDGNGNYAYYTTDTFPYVVGCFVGEVEIEGPGGDGDGPGGDAGRPADGGGGAGLDLTEAAEALGVTVEELQAALGGQRPDFDAAAAALGITVEELQAVLPAAPG